VKKKRNLPLATIAGLLRIYLSPQKGRAILLVILLFGGIGLQLANPQIVRYFLDTAEARSGIEKLFGAAALFMGIAIMRQIVTVATTYVSENVAWTATNLLRADLALHCLKLDMTFHKRYKPGELVERVDGDVNQLANFFSQLIIRLGGSLLLVMGVLVLLWWQDWRIGASIAAAALIGMVVLNWLNRHTVPRWQIVREADAKLFGYLEEWLGGTQAIRTNRAEGFVMRRLYESLRARWQSVMAAMQLQVLVADLPLGVFALAYSSAYILSSGMFRDGLVTIGEVYLIFYYLSVMEDPLWEISRQIEDLQRAAASINRITELRQIRPALDEGPGVEFPPGPIAVTFDDVSFYYADDVESQVLRNINFTIRPGRTLGLLGRTGSGKSTLSKLLFRFYDPTGGAIYLGDGDAHQFDIRLAQKAVLRHRIGMVTQEVQLFRASVRQNVTLFDDTIEDEQVLQAIEDVGMGPWLSGLPDGLETTLEAGGGGLSAGEAQLLAFARVFLTDPGLVILDEASARLDPATELLLESAVDRLLSNRTGIVVAHRLGTIQRADDIMILDGGRIAEQGARLDLAGREDSLFYQLMQTGLQETMA
jgi:ABC-type multidrug transport system fused ATPase/permease subunit